MTETKPTFNLWIEPWITLEKEQGGVERLSIEDTLKHAQEYHAIYETSPLVVVGIHRLLVGILQFALDPQENNDLEKLWRAGKFPVNKIEEFGRSYGHRFDLFSDKEPFLQSGDISIQPSSTKSENTRIPKLFPDMPANDYVTHYRHGHQDDQVLCPKCLAGGLVSIPAFMISGGRGLKPSINGIPPIYILPGGKTVFESLTASLLTPQRKPRVASRKKDDVWWIHKPVVVKDCTVFDVGYLHSLTFPVRRIRFHPEKIEEICTRCGNPTEIMVKTMIFQMGEKRAEGAEIWIDPFVAYRKGQDLKPIRPSEGKVLWREYSSLFLQDLDNTLRPEILDQISDLKIKDLEYLSFRCVGLKTERQGKITEWIDAGFDIPLSILENEEAGPEVREVLRFVEDIVEIAKGVFGEYIGGKAGGSPTYKDIKKKAKNILKSYPPVSYRKGERSLARKSQMEQLIWDQLSASFREYILLMAVKEKWASAKLFWVNRVVFFARDAFNKAILALGDNGITLNQTETAKKIFDILVSIKRKEFVND
jgi:CRISPR system Cascade subunit CasA